MFMRVLAPCYYFSHDSGYLRPRNPLARLSHQVWFDCSFVGELVHFSLSPFSVLVFLSGSPSGFVLLECLRRTTAFCCATRGGVFGLGVLQQRRAAQAETKVFFQGYAFE